MGTWRENGGGARSWRVWQEGRESDGKTGTEMEMEKRIMKHPPSAEG